MKFLSAVKLGTEPTADVDAVTKKYVDDENMVSSGVSLPSPKAKRRGRIFVLLDDVKGDSPYVCLRQADGTYKWRNLIALGELA